VEPSRLACSLRHWPLERNSHGLAKNSGKYQKLISNEDEQGLGELCQGYRDSVSDISVALDRVSASRTDSSLVLELWETV
jgi:hypothetical protein